MAPLYERSTRSTRQLFTYLLLKDRGEKNTVWFRKKHGFGYGRHPDTTRVAAELHAFINNNDARPIFVVECVCVGVYFVLQQQMNKKISILIRKCKMNFN